MRQSTTYTLIVDGTAPSGLTNAQGRYSTARMTAGPTINFHDTNLWHNLVINPRILKKYLPSLPRIVAVKTKPESADVVNPAARLFSRSERVP